LNKLIWLSRLITQRQGAKIAKMMQEPTHEEDQVAKTIVDSAIHVHRQLGPGLLESVYETCLFDTLTRRDLDVKKQVPINIEFDGRLLDAGFRADLIVNNSVIIEIKSIKKLSKLQHAQILTYMRFSKMRLGLLMNFNVPLMKDGLKRFYRSDI